jgi:hypothetical protein
MIYKYLSFSISIAFISWIVGMLINAILRKTEFYNNHLTKLNFFPGERTNKLIGINIFRWIVKNTFFKSFNQKLKFKRKIEKEDLIKLRAEMTISETDHLIAFAFVTVFAIVKFLHFGYLFGLVIMLINIFMNLYPTLLQQENKRRIDKLIIKL